ncbi:hypothetical protein ABE854_02590 [Enterococcus faecium]|uniref:hypothetical protein n=1 Tax=Enterococcus faecium TaxID=1352 RepID=UPI003D6C50AB
MFLYLFAMAEEKSGLGLKKSFLVWIRYFRKSSSFRKMFLLVFFTNMILFRTLLDRYVWLNPLSNVFGSWWIYSVNETTGEIRLTTECFENVILFIPFIILVMWYKASEKDFGKIYQRV